MAGHCVKACVIFPLLLAGCAGIPRIKIPGKAELVGVRDAGKPATLNSGEVRNGFDVPAESKLVVTRTEAQPATSNTPARPAYEVSEWVFAGPTRFEHLAASLSADTGTVDTSVAMRRIDASERRWLLWAAIGCGIAGLLAMQLVPAWPSLGRGLLGAGVAAFAAWKLADIPSWLWLVVIGVAVLVVLGYKRAESDSTK